MKNLNYLIILIFSAFILLVLLRTIAKKQNTKKQLYYCFSIFIVLLLIWTFSLILQIIFQNSNIKPVYFEYIAAFGGCFSSVVFFFLALIFTKTKIYFKKWYLLLFVIPIISCLVLWTNDYHNLFYITYSTSVTNTVFGPYFNVHSIYTYLLFGISILYFLRYSFKNSGVFSKQSNLIILGTLAPIAINVIGLFGVEMTVYLTPISFAITALFFAFAIFKFGFMKLTPIALQRIVDRISDGYLVVDENNIVTDFNATFLNMFSTSASAIRGVNLFKLIEKEDKIDVDKNVLLDCIRKVKNSKATFRFEKKLTDKDMYFNIEINSIRNDKTFLGTLILFKDTTQHMIDMQTIQDNQNMLMERERLASLGQLIGGIAHNLKTPIMSIAGAAEGLTDLTNEYDASIGDPEVTASDHHDIAKDMREWIEKIRSYTEYMSDVITAVKGQAVTMSDEQAVSFTLDELVKRVDILMKHELKNALVTLNVQMEADPNIVLQGNINSLVQVINNMISNAIQAYNGTPNQNIDFILSQEGGKVTISVQDYAGGLPDEVQQKLFKEMITTKGKNGTGLGLFMSYSTIRAHFNGNISYETQKGNGTVFHIVLPRS